MKETKKFEKVIVRDEEDTKKLINRLSRIEGQIRGISQMVENGRKYEDVIIQMMSVMNALKGLSNYLVREHLTTKVLPNLSEKELNECMETLDWLDKIK